MLLSIDIGIRHLAFCCMSSANKKDLTTYKIELWDVYNTLESDEYQCQGIQNNGKTCGRKCGYKYQIDKTTTYCCKTHFPKHIQQTKLNVFKKKLIESYLLQDIAKIVLAKVQNVYDTHQNVFEGISQILIELQPGVNKKMVFTSHLVYAKLVELYKDTTTSIKFVRASEKLKAYTGPDIECKLKGSYAQRKWLSVQYIRWFLLNKFSQEQREKWLPYFDSLKVQPDCADTALMAINGLFGVPKKQLKFKNGSEIK